MSVELRRYSDLSLHIKQPQNSNFFLNTAIQWTNFNEAGFHFKITNAQCLSMLRPSTENRLDQWFSNFLHQVPPQKIFGFPSTTIMTNIKMQYKCCPLLRVCVHGVCVCVFTAVCVCTLDGLNAEHKFRVCHFH